MSRPPDRPARRPRRRRLQPQTLAIGILGVLTPIGILVVNASAWILQHLTPWRDGVAIMAFMSACLLNSFTGFQVYRFLATRWPDFFIAKPDHRIKVFLGGAVVILATALGAGYFSFVGMERPSQLPNGVAVVTAFSALVIPLGIAGLSNRFRRETIVQRTGSSSAPRPGE